MDGDEVLISFGGELKALGDGKVGGYLVTFGDAKHTDISGMRDFFTPNTDFDIEDGAKTSIYFDHGLDPVLKQRKIGRGTMRVDDVGVWVEGHLNQRDEYEKAIYGMVEKKKLSWSSGTAPHLVERKAVGRAHEIKRWPLGLDASLTPTPAEPRCTACSLKSYREDGERIVVKFEQGGTEKEEGRSLDGLPLNEHSKAVLDAVAGYRKRVGALVNLRKSEGKKTPLNQAHLKALNDLSCEIEEALKGLRELVAETKTGTRSEATLLALEYERMKASSLGVEAA